MRNTSRSFFFSPSYNPNTQKVCIINEKECFIGYLRTESQSISIPEGIFYMIFKHWEVKREGVMQLIPKSGEGPKFRENAHKEVARVVILSL